MNRELVVHRARQVLRFARARIELDGGELAGASLQVHAQRRSEAAEIDQILLARLSQAPVGLLRRCNALQLLGIFASRRRTRQKFIVRLKFPPLGASKNRLEMMQLLFPGLIFHRPQVKGAWIAAAAEVGRAKTSDDVTSGHNDVPRGVANGLEAGAVVLIGHTVTV